MSKPTQEDEGVKFQRLVREGLAKRKDADVVDESPPTRHPQGGAWFWYLVLAIMAFAAIMKTVGAP